MSDQRPLEISSAEWDEITGLPFIQELWGHTDAEDLRSLIYGVKFDFVSGSPGYCGDLFILQGDALTEHPPVVLIRGDNQRLVQWQ
jgi:hypothetical protein